MAYIVQQRDIDILRQSNKELYYRLELLNHSLKVIDSLEGNLIDDNFSNDATSDIRRNHSVELHVSDSSFNIGADKKIWIDKYMRPYIGVKHQRSGEIVWYLRGTFVFNDTNYAYNATSRTLSLSCSDLMCTLNGDRGGYIEGLNITIHADSNIRNVIIGLLTEAGITKYYIENINKTIPYDLEYSAGTTYYQILKDILDLYAGWEMFFDINGTFIVQQIPTAKNDAVSLDESVFDALVISEAKSSTFNKIYNYTQVWGKTIELDYYANTSVSSNGITYTANLSHSPTTLENFAKYGVLITKANSNNPTLNFNGIGAKKIVGEDGLGIKSNRLILNTNYVFKYRKATDDFLLLGQYQAYGEYRQYDIDCDYSITNLGYEIKQVLLFNELESDDLCEQRAKYETWLSTRMQDVIDLSMIIIPFLDVNWKVSYTLNTTGETNDYLIKSISGSHSNFTMSVKMIRFSELYPDIIPSS